MEEKLIVISIDDEIVDSDIDTTENAIKLYNSCKSIEILEVLEFEAFVFVNAKWR